SPRAPHGNETRASDVNVGGLMEDMLMVTTRDGSQETVFGRSIEGVPPIGRPGATVDLMDRLDTLAGRALIVMVDDRVAHGDAADESGPLVSELLTEDGFLVDGTVVIPSDEVEIRKALNTAVIGGVDLVVSIGGTGVSPRDVTPEVTAEILDRDVPGIAEALRSSALAAGSVEGGLSRGVAGISGSTLVVNLAGTREALRDAMATLSRLVRHVIGDLSRVDE